MSKVSTVHICAIFKNEAPYLAEWLEFHQLVGVSKFFLYNNNSQDDYMAVLQPYIDSGVVDLTEWPMQPPSQFAAYAHYIERNNKQPVWTAFIDLDEYLFAPCKNTLNEVLGQIDTPGAFGVNWMCFGSGGLDKKDDRLLMERFTLRCNENNWENTHIKSVIRMDQDVAVGTDPHFFRVQYGTYNEQGKQLTGPWSPHVSRVLRINHYKTKSREEWLARAISGKPDRFKYDIDWKHFDSVNTTEVDDRTIQRFLPQVKENLLSKKFLRSLDI